MPVMWLCSVHWYVKVAAAGQREEGGSADLVARYIPTLLAYLSRTMRARVMSDKCGERNGGNLQLEFAVLSRYMFMCSNSCVIALYTCIYIQYMYTMHRHGRKWPEMAM